MLVLYPKLTILDLFSSFFLSLSKLESIEKIAMLEEEAEKYLLKSDSL